MGLHRRWVSGVDDVAEMSDLVMSRYPFREAVPNNFRWRGDLTPERELWWVCYGAALELAHRDWDRKPQEKK